MELRELIRKRHSVAKYSKDAVDPKVIVELLDDAVYAPNHKMREPWRFILISHERAKFLKEEVRHLLDPDMEKKFDHIFSAPMVIAFVNQLTENLVDELEDLQATAAVIQNFMLLALERGLGSFWKTPAMIESDAFKDYLGLKTNEIIVSLVMVGYPLLDQGHPKKRIPAHQKTTIY